MGCAARSPRASRLRCAAAASDRTAHPAGRSPGRAAIEHHRRPDPAGRPARRHRPVDHRQRSLGGNFLSRLNMDLRETKGWSYGVRGGAQHPRQRRRLHRLGAGPGRPHRRRAGRAQRRHRRFLSTKGVTQEELERNVTNSINGLPGRVRNVRRAAPARCMRNDLLGRPDNYYEACRRAIAPRPPRRSTAPRGRRSIPRASSGWWSAMPPRSGRSSTSSGCRSRWSSRSNPEGQSPSAGDVAHLAAGARLALAVEVEVGAGLGDRRRPVVGFIADQIGPSSRAPRVRSVDPSGSPQTARMCCSNCEVSAPSIVQCPLLWTRGAISLTSGPSAQAKNSTASTPTCSERVGDPAGERAASSICRRSASPAGSSERRRMPLSWVLRGLSHTALSPSSVRASEHREFGKIVDRRLGDAGRRADRVPGLARFGRHRGPRPGPCRRSRTAGS